MLTQKAKIIWIGVGVVAAIVILTIIIVVVSRPAPKPEPVGPSVQPSAGQMQVDELVARVLGGADPSTCFEAGESSGADRCFYRVASMKSDATLCEQITAEALRAECVGGIAAMAVAMGANPDTCVSIQDQAARQNCIANAVDEGVESDFCQKFDSDDVQFCSNQIAFHNAIVTDDVSACEALLGEDLRDECLSVALFPSRKETPPPLPVDTDSDGIIDDQENEFGTDPTNPDTDGDGLSDKDELEIYDSDPLKIDSDGDGFEDKVEVDAGYNPSGPGRL